MRRRGRKEDRMRDVKEKNEGENITRGESWIEEEWKMRERGKEEER